LVRRRCVGCHGPVEPRGGLNLQLFDAASADPAVAGLMTVKIVKDNAMMAAGKPVPDDATVDRFVKTIAAALAQRDGVQNQWFVDLQVDPRVPNRGHSLVVARRQSERGEVRFTCNGATRQPKIEVSTESQTSQMVAEFDGLSPTIRNVFAWCFTD